MYLDKENPLWIPKGSVRALLAIGVVSCYAYVCVISENYEALGLIAVMAMKDYFESKKQ